MRLTRPQLAAQHRLAGLRGGARGAEETAWEIAAALEPAIGWDKYRLFATDARGSGFERLLAASPGDGPSRELVLRESYQTRDQSFLVPLGLDRPLAELPRALAVQPRQVDCFGVDPSIRQAEDTRAYGAAWDRLQDGFGHLFRTQALLMVVIPGRDGPVAVLNAARHAPGRDFPASAVAFASLVAPLIGEALADAIGHDLGADAPLPTTTGILLVGPAGDVTYASPAAREWLAALGRAPGDEETSLPISLLMAMGRLRTRPDSAETTIRTRGGRARVEVTPGGPDGTVAMMISADRDPEDAIRVAAAARDLTGAEERVARLVGRGLSNREVAAELSVSANTVEWHLRRVFDKLDVRNRAQLVSRYGSGPGAPAAASPVQVGLAGKIVTPGGTVTGSGDGETGVASQAPRRLVRPAAWQVPGMPVGSDPDAWARRGPGGDG